MVEESKLLIVEDDEDILTSCRLLLKKHFARIITTNSPAAIPQLMAEHDFHAILLDMNFTPRDHSGRDGLKWLDHILLADPAAIVIMITAYSSVDAAVEAMKLGAADFIEKPWNNEKLVSTLKAAVRLRNAQSESSRLRHHTRIVSQDLTRRHHPIVGESAAIARVLDVVSRAAPTDANIMILGESGTGKELIAREVHARSARADEVFASVDLGAIAESLIESELFGYKQGAFTDAREDRPGRFQAAQGGTFFLDEIGNLPLAVQPKLLTVLENREVTPLGGQRPEPIDIRLVSATNLDPETLKNGSMFRRDLLYRLNTVEVVLPPLRERRDDIPLLIRAFLGQYARKFNRTVHGLSDPAMDLLLNYHWPGNIRELRYSIERAVILMDGDELDVEDFAALTAAARTTDPEAAGSLQHMEESAVRRALAKYEGNVSAAARELGLTRTSLYRRMRKYEIQ